MSYLLQNIARFSRALIQNPAEAPRLLAKTAGGKFSTLGNTALARSGLAPLLYHRYRGRGVIAMFHEIHTDVEAGLRMGCSPEQLRRVLKTARDSGRDLVTIDEALRRLEDPEALDFVVITFDDGYRDNRDIALPILEEFNAPMVMFTPTGMITRDIYAWWLGLRALLTTKDTVDIEPMGQRFNCDNAPSRNAALRQILLWIGTDQSRADSLRAVFDRHALSLPALVDAVALNETELKEFASHPLVTIGGHTTTHRFLSNLAEDDARSDIADNRRYLQDLVDDQPIGDFAYPYGSPDACGEREARLVADAGYRCGFTTRSGNVFADHLKTPHLIPREDLGAAFQSQNDMMSRLDGWRRARVVPGKGPVAGLE